MWGCVSVRLLLLPVVVFPRRLTLPVSWLPTTPGEGVIRVIRVTRVIAERGVIGGLVNGWVAADMGGCRGVQTWW